MYLCVVLMTDSLPLVLPPPNKNIFSLAVEKWLVCHKDIFNGKVLHIKLIRLKYSFVSIMFIVAIFQTLKFGCTDLHVLKVLFIMLMKHIIRISNMQIKHLDYCIVFQPQYFSLGTIYIKGSSLEVWDHTCPFIPDSWRAGTQVFRKLKQILSH